MNQFNSQWLVQNNNQYRLNLDGLQAWDTASLEQKKNWAYALEGMMEESYWEQLVDGQLSLNEFGQNEGPIIREFVSDKKAKEYAVLSQLSSPPRTYAMGDLSNTEQQLQKRLDTTLNAIEKGQSEGFLSLAELNFKVKYNSGGLWGNLPLSQNFMAAVDQKILRIIQNTEDAAHTKTLLCFLSQQGLVQLMVQSNQPGIVESAKGLYEKLKQQEANSIDMNRLESTMASLNSSSLTAQNGSDSVSHHAIEALKRGAYGLNGAARHLLSNVKTPVPGGVDAVSQWSKQSFNSIATALESLRVSSTLGLLWAKEKFDNLRTYEGQKIGFHPKAFASAVYEHYSEVWSHKKERIKHSIGELTQVMKHPLSHLPEVPKTPLKIAGKAVGVLQKVTPSASRFENEGLTGKFMRGSIGLATGAAIAIPVGTALAIASAPVVCIYAAMALGALMTGKLAYKKSTLATDAARNITKRLLGGIEMGLERVQQKIQQKMEQKELKQKSGMKPG